MSDEKTGRDLVPRPDEQTGAVAPREPALPAPAGESATERFRAGEQAHTVGLTEQRSTQIVRQSGNARMVAFLGALLIVLFIPLYWLYDIGLPVVGFGGRLQTETQEQYVTDVSRGYALFLANCARCHGTEGQGGVGPPLNDQAKLYAVLTKDGQSGKGHLNPDYIRSVLTEGGRMVCGDANSVMPAWLQPKGPLNYREVEDIIKFITASKDTKFTYQPQHVIPPATIPPPVDETGWRDPTYSPPPDATPVPACWRAPAASAAPGTPAPLTSPGTADHPRVIEIQASEQFQWVDPATGSPITQIAVVAGETVEFHVINNTANGHNFHIGSATELSSAPEHNDMPGVDTFNSNTMTFTYTFDNVPSQPQWACTVLGHYQMMHGDFVVQPAASAAP